MKETSCGHGDQCVEQCHWCASKATQALATLRSKKVSWGPPAGIMYYFTIALIAEGQVYVIIQHVFAYGGRHLHFITINIAPKSRS